MVGYAGQGGKEYFKPEFSFKIDEGDIMQFAQKVEEVAIKLNNDDETIINMSQKATNYINENYNLKNEEESIVTTWKRILKRT